MRSLILVLAGFALVWSGCEKTFTGLKCEDECTGARPHCSEELGNCVECLPASEEADCGAGSVCVVVEGDAFCGDCRDPDPWNHGLVECEDGMCSDGACVGCASDADCGAAAPRCDLASNTCGACSAATEAIDCSGNACDPIAHVCGEAKLGTVPRAAECISDSECQVDSACVQVTFAGAPAEFVCLRPVAAGCSGAFQNPTPLRTSRSGDPEQQYCGWNEEQVSAEAMRALDNGRECGEDGDCGAGGLCKTLSVGSRCTIPCEAATDCPTTGYANGCYAATHCGTPQ